MKNTSVTLSDPQQDWYYTTNFDDSQPGRVTVEGNYKATTNQLLKTAYTIEQLTVEQCAALELGLSIQRFLETGKYQGLVHISEEPNVITVME